MARYEIVGDEVELYFDKKPSDGTRTEMKAIKIWWNPDKMCWHGKNTKEVLALAQRLCAGVVTAPDEDVNLVPVSDTARCCYYNSVETFLKENKESWVEKMKEAFYSSYSMSLSESQIKAWRDCFDVLLKELPDVNN